MLSIIRPAGRSCECILLAVAAARQVACAHSSPNLARAGGPEHIICWASTYLVETALMLSWLSPGLCASLDRATERSQVISVPRHAAKPPLVVLHAVESCCSVLRLLKHGWGGAYNFSCAGELHSNRDSNSMYIL